MRKRSLFGVIVYMVILAVLCSWLLGLFGDGTNGLTYSEVVELFHNEQVRSFEVRDHKIYLELHTSLNGNSEIVANLADVESFRQEMWQTFQDQKAAGTLESYDFLPEAPFNPYALVIPLILAGGVLLIFTRPFSVDDMIEVGNGGIVGVVEDIRIVSTKLRTGDNKVVYIPNGTLANSSIINYSEKDTRRVDFTFSIAYESDFEKAKALVADICAAHKLVLKDPAPLVRVSEHADSAITLTARAWVKTEDYWTVYWDVLEACKKVFDESGIEIPYNKLDVNIKNQ